MITVGSRRYLKYPAATANTTTNNGNNNNNSNNNNPRCPECVIIVGQVEKNISIFFNLIFTDLGRVFNFNLDFG